MSERQNGNLLAALEYNTTHLAKAGMSAVYTSIVVIPVFLNLRSRAEFTGPDISPASMHQATWGQERSLRHDTLIWRENLLFQPAAV